MTTALVRYAALELGADPLLGGEEQITEGMREHGARQVTAACARQPDMAIVSSVFLTLLTTEGQQIFEDVGSELDR